MSSLEAVRGETTAKIRGWNRPGGKQQRYRIAIASQRDTNLCSAISRRRFLVSASTMAAVGGLAGSARPVVVGGLCAGLTIETSGIHVLMGKNLKNEGNP